MDRVFSKETEGCGFMAACAQHLSKTLSDLGTGTGYLTSGKNAGGETKSGTPTYAIVSKSRFSYSHSITQPVFKGQPSYLLFHYVIAPS